MLTLNDGRNELWQWDTGRKLTVDADCSQVHFSNKVFGRSIDVDVVGGLAIIPDILLQTDKDLTAWAFVGTAENGYTKISKVFKVNKRNKPADYVFTPTEQTTLEEIKERLDDLEAMQDPDAIKDAVEDYLEQNPVKAPVQSVNGHTGDVNLTSKDVGAISQDNLQEATNEALAQAKASGEFDGQPGKDGEPGKDAPQESVLYTKQELTKEQQAQARKNIGASSGLISILDSDPAEPEEGQMWILKTTTEELTTPVIELGEVRENSIAIKLSNASFDGSGSVVASYNIYVNGILNKTETIVAGGTCVVTGLSPETEYQISVRGVKGAVLSEVSNTQTATTEESTLDGEIIIILGASAGQSGGNIQLSNAGWTGTERATAVYTAGKKPCVNAVTDETVYPIPVPADATSVTVVCPGLRFGYNGWNIDDANTYSYDVDSGWQSSGTPYNFEAGAAEYATIGFSKSNNSNLTADDIANITITFGTNAEPDEPDEPEDNTSDIVVIPRYSVGVSGNRPGVQITNNSVRACIVATHGDIQIIDSIESADYFLINVPKNATSCTVVCPGLMWGFNGWNRKDNGSVSYDIDSGWKSSDVTYTFEAGAAEYASIGFKKGSAGTEEFTENDEVLDGITITFE